MLDFWRRHTGRNTSVKWLVYFQINLDSFMLLYIESNSLILIFHDNWIFRVFITDLVFVLPGRLSDVREQFNNLWTITVRGKAQYHWLTLRYAKHATRVGLMYVRAAERSWIYNSTWYHHCLICNCRSNHPNNHQPTKYCPGVPKFGPGGPIFGPQATRFGPWSNRFHAFVPRFGPFFPRLVPGFLDLVLGSLCLVPVSLG